MRLKKGAGVSLDQQGKAQSTLNSGISESKLLSGQSTGEISGAIIMEGHDNGYHGLGGWKVGAYAFVGGLPNYKLGETIVEPDGSWVIHVKTTDMSRLNNGYRIIYKTENQYDTVLDNNQVLYQWYQDRISSDARTGINVKINGQADLWDVTNFAFLSSTSISDRLGLPIVEMDSSNTVQPIRVLYPAINDLSGNSLTVSYYNKVGDLRYVLVKSDKGWKGTTILHELFHALNAKTWGDKTIAGSGGKHDGSKCYTGYSLSEKPVGSGVYYGGYGNTLTEGVANFFVVWVAYPSFTRNYLSFTDLNSSVLSNDLGWNAEFKQSYECSNGIQNERMVTRTFWDLYDFGSNNEPADDRGFTIDGAVMAAYLIDPPANNNERRTLYYYLARYKSLVRNPDDKAWIDSVFNINKVSPPQ